MKRIIVIIMMFTAICSIPFLVSEKDDVMAISPKITHPVPDSGTDLLTYSDINAVVADLMK